VGPEAADELSQFAELIRFSYASPDSDTRVEAFKQLYDLPAYLKRTCPDGKTYLEKLKQMEPMMDSPQGRSEKWERFRESIRTIDLNDPENSGEKKLQEILDKTVDYTKGKKSLRRKQADQNCFDQSLDVLSVLAEGGEYARLAAQAVVDRTNEVRLGHDKDYNKISLKGYGLKHIAEHTNVKDRETLKAFENSFVRPKGTLKRTGFQVKREDDPSALEPVPKKHFKAGLYNLKDAMWDCEKLASGETLSEFEAKGDVAAALALAETQVYYRASHGGKKKGIILSANHLVIDADAYTQKKIALLSDPALEQLAKKYQDPEARKALFPPASPPKKHEPKGVGEAPAPEDPRGEVSYRPDIRSLKIEKLQEELAEIRRTMEQPEAAPAL
jgi:hypothetical protein